MSMIAPLFAATPQEQWQEIRRGVAEILPEEEFVQKIEQAFLSGRPLKVKLGIDPSRPDLHLGHYVVLQKLRLLQTLGHEVHFLIGDFTARIGDPTGRNQTRPVMTEAEIRANAHTYQTQVFRILDERKTHIDFNSTWLKPLDLAFLIQMLMTTSLSQMLAREDFSKRFHAQEPLFLHELLYPLLQGYDSVALHADVELGGTEQKFNLLMGRHLQKIFHQTPQAVLMMPLLEGLDGVQKMSKSLNNTISITDPPSEQFGKILSLSDPLMHRYYELLSHTSVAEQEAIRSGQIHPLEAKKRLAEEIVSLFHGKSAAQEARRSFEAQFSAKDPSVYPLITLSLPANHTLDWIDWLTANQVVSSRSQARRLLEQGAIRWNGETCTQALLLCTDQTGGILQVGKRKGFQIQFQFPS